MVKLLKTKQKFRKKAQKNVFLTYFLEELTKNAENFHFWDFA